MANIILTGLNGYGSNFVRELLQDDSNKLIAVVSGSPKKSKYYSQLTECGTHFYKSIESCLAEKTPDMAIICTPMHVHYKEVRACLEHGVSVYCEKPLTTTWDHFLELKNLANEKGVILAVAFQWSFSKGIQNLKCDLLADKYGKITRMKTYVNWTRPISYYTESDWKGRNRDASGQIVFDNITSNQCAHYLHNMLFLSGAEMTKSLDIENAHYEVRAYRAHNIETFDTISLKIRKNDLQIGFWGTLVSESDSPVEFEIICEEAKIVFPYDAENHIAAIHQNGTLTLYDNPNNDLHMHYQKVVNALNNDTPVACDVVTVGAFQQVIEYLRKHVVIQNFDKSDIIRSENSVTVKDIASKLYKAYLEEIMLE